jgi:flavorubredoxin
MGAIDWDRRLFDGLIPLPDGTSYNAYLVRGSEKTVLLDTVDPTMVDVLLDQLADVPKLDYIIAHHAEQDHSGAIPFVLDKYTDAKVLTNPQGKGLLMDHLDIPEDRFVTVKNGETLSLGDKTLEFVYTPWVHWPETMSTYLKEDKILFSCDFFGSHLATTDLYAGDDFHVVEAAKRYYAEIMMPFRKLIQKNLDKVEERDVDLIAPSHGPVYDQPAVITGAYRDWVSDGLSNSVVLPYVSMHGSTAKIVDHLVSALAASGVTVHRFDMSAADVGKLAITLVDAASIVFATPTVLAGPHPLVLYAAHLANALRPKLKYASVVGSYAWGGKSVEQITGAISGLKVEMLGPVLCKGLPKQSDLEALDKLAKGLVERHRELDLP